MSFWIGILGAVLVVEGALYAAFPNHARRVLARMALMDEGALRFGGLAALAGGLALVWLTR